MNPLNCLVNVRKLCYFINIVPPTFTQLIHWSRSTQIPSVEAKVMYLQDTVHNSSNITVKMLTTELLLHLGEEAVV